MTGEENAQPPLLCRGLIRLASWIVPSRARSEWRAKWDRSLRNWRILFERGELTAKDHADLLHYSWSSFREAFWLRITPGHLRHTMHSPGFLLAAAAAVIVVLAVLSEGFAGARTLFRPWLVADPGQLVSIRYTGALNQPYGVPPRLVTLWRARSGLLDDLAGYVREPYWHARVTPNFFSLLGVQAALGRTFRAGDGDVAVLGNAVWRSVYGGDPHAVGKTMGLDGREFIIIGVLPAGFWAISRTIRVWTPVSLEPGPGPDAPFLIGAVGRLKKGASRDELRGELLRAARASGRYLPRAPEVVAYWNVPERPLTTYATVSLFALAVGILMLVRARLLSLRHRWRYGAFLALKTLLAVAVPLLAWIEASAALRAWLPESGLADILAGWVLTAAFVLGSALAMWWVFADQRRRCPVCLYRLAMPVTMGSWASVLDPVTTELLCDAGHGSLCLPETETGSESWTDMDASWSDLFEKKE
jgi:hypothetical protein